MPGQLLNSGTYLRIINGNFAQTVDKDTIGAKLREYEVNGQKGSKWEISFANWTGCIKTISFKNSEYGRSCNIDLGDAILVLNTEHRYFSDFACKIKNANIKKEITFHPYDFESDGKRYKGISIQQEGNKLSNYYYDFDKKKSLHEFPQIDEKQKEKLKKNYWKVYFAEVEEFLVSEIEKIKMPQTIEEIFADNTIPDIPPIDYERT